MDDDTQQTTAPQEHPNTQPLTDSGVIQPPVSIAEEMKSQQAGHAQAQPAQPTEQNTSQAATSGTAATPPQPMTPQSIYPEATRGVGTVAPTPTPATPAPIGEDTQDNAAPAASKGSFVKKHFILIAAVIIVAGAGLFFLLHSLPAVLPSTDIATPASDFSEYTYSADYHNETVRYLYYKGSHMGNKGPNTPTGLVSPALSGGRLPLAISFTGLRRISEGQPKCIVNSQGNSYKFSVYMPSIKANVNVCALGSVQNSGVTAYDFEFATKQDTYLGKINLNDGAGLAGGPKDNLAHYTTDIKRIVASVQPSG